MKASDRTRQELVIRSRAVNLARLKIWRYEFPASKDKAPYRGVASRLHSRLQGGGGGGYNEKQNILSMLINI